MKPEAVILQVAKEDRLVPTPKSGRPQPLSPS
jgi:hypothetical protein